jgi:hypothetical protein
MCDACARDIGYDDYVGYGFEDYNVAEFTILCAEQISNYRISFSSLLKQFNRSQLRINTTWRSAALKAVVSSLPFAQPFPDLVNPVSYVHCLRTYLGS